MNHSQETYTYRAGQKIVLEKRPDQFIVRALPKELETAGIPNAEQVSPSSSRVTTRSTDLEALMSRSRHLAPTHHAYYVADTGEEFLITDRIFVTFREPLTPDKVDAFAAQYSLVKKKSYSDREYLFQLTNHTGINPVKLVVKLTEEEPLVESVEHDLSYRARKYQLALPTDPSYVRQWHLHTRFSHPQVDPRSSSRCEDAWQLLGNFGSSDVVIAILDDGCKMDHIDFNTPGKFAGWGYFKGDRLVQNTDIDADPARMYESGSDHGTACAGVASGVVNAALTVGAAPGCRLFPIKWESQGPFLSIDDSKLRDALDYLADKVDIASNSWGVVPRSLWPPNVTNRIAQLAQSGGRRGRGIVFLWAAGNENCPIQHTASVAVPYTDGWNDTLTQWIGVRTTRFFQNNLVGIPGVLHIAALASNAQRSHYSNYGAGIDLCAPTNNVHEYRRLTVPGLGITTTTGPASDVTNFFGGTSSATPLVAGVAALVISANPELTALDVISVLKRTAAKDLNFQGYNRTPPASFDPNPTWDISPVSPFDNGEFQTVVRDPNGTWSPWFGYGKVNAHAAVDEALNRGSGPTPVLQFESSPGRAIPDNNLTGIQDVIHVPDPGRLQDIRIQVDIKHTWIGDLRVLLRAPDGTTVVLHDRSGGSQDNVKETYDFAKVPTLGSLRDRSLTGNWTLQVQDLAAQDVGTLNNWKLEITISSALLVVEDIASIRIPDNSPTGVQRILNLSAGKIIKDISVSIDITHTWIGDLRVTLTPPGSAPIPLHNQTGGSADNLIRTYRAQEVVGLQALRGRDTGGAWQLHVADLVSQDEGKLNRWGIEVVV
jgi:subtilisin-like proprotein convertase family protein